MKRSISLEWTSTPKRASPDNELESENAICTSAFSGDASLAESVVSIDLEAQQQDTLSLLMVDADKVQEQDDELSITARTVFQSVFIFWIMTTPATCMLISLWVLRSIWAAAISFHVVACVLLPYAYIRLCFSNEHALSLLQALVRNPRRQAAFGSAYWLAFAGLGSAFYWMMGRLIIPNQQAVVEDLGISDDTSSVAFGVYFCVANPIVEELFWRGFLVQALGRKESALWTISAMYASYHVVVLYTLQFEPVLVAVCAVLLVVAGRLFSLLAGFSGVGSSALAHCAADMVIISVLFDWRFLQAHVRF